MAQRFAAAIEGIGLVGPGLRNWSEGRAVLSSSAAHAPAPTELPPPAILPASERRRASQATKLVLAIGLEAAADARCDPATLATVFSSSGGDGYNCHEICQQLATDDRQLSPTRFHNSVHNAPAGYWGIASGSMAPSSVICVHDASFGAGLLEAIAHVVTLRERCLLIAYDTDYPEPLRAVRPTPDAFGIALVLAPCGDAVLDHSASQGKSPLATIDVRMLPAADAAPSRLTEPTLEALRVAIASARGLPLLQAIASNPRETSASVVIEYLPDTHLAFDVRPC